MHLLDSGRRSKYLMTSQLLHSYSLSYCLLIREGRNGGQLWKSKTVMIILTPSCTPGTTEIGMNWREKLQKRISSLVCCSEVVNGMCQVTRLYNGWRGWLGGQWCHDPAAMIWLVLLVLGQDPAPASACHYTHILIRYVSCDSFHLPTLLLFSKGFRIGWVQINRPTCFLHTTLDT